MKKILTTLLMSFMLTAAFAQNATIMSLAQAELAKRGLNETEVRARLVQNGIDVDNLKPSDYASYQARIMQILDQMQAEKAGTAATTGTAAADSVSTQIGIEIAAPVTVQAVSTVDEKPQRQQSQQRRQQNRIATQFTAIPSLRARPLTFTARPTAHRHPTPIFLATVTRFIFPSSVLPRQKFTSASPWTDPSSPQAQARSSLRE